MRMLAVFEKGERIRHIGHLDIQRSVQRGLRRSGLPVAYSQGFSPHILIAFASALSTGACGKREIMDVTMAEGYGKEGEEAREILEKEFLERMNRAMPPEMQLKEARLVDSKHPSLSTLLAAAEYDLLIRDPETAGEMMDAIPAMMAKQTVPAMRKTKTKLTEVDIKPLILSLNGEGCHLHATLVLTEKESCKPQMLLEALKSEAGVTDDIRMLIIRERLFGRNEDGLLVPLEKM